MREEQAHSAAQYREAIGERANLYHVEKNPVRVTSDGWLTNTPGRFYFMRDNPPPRPYSYWQHIHKVGGLYHWFGPGAGFAAIGLFYVGLLLLQGGQATGLVFPAFFWGLGILLQVFQIRRLYQAVSCYRNGRLKKGHVIGTFEGPSDEGSIPAVEVQLDNGQKSVVFLDNGSWEVLAGFEVGRNAQVMVLEQPSFHVDRTPYHEPIAFRLE